MLRRDVDPERIRQREIGLQRAALVWILSGLVFMLLPGTFLGVWNLLSITGGHEATQVAPAWIQAHGHAQIFGWIGCFILGIGFYSLSKMAGAGTFPLWRVWATWVLWVGGVWLRWVTNVWLWHWRWALPASAALEMAGFLIFFASVRGHRDQSGASGTRPRAVWVWIVTTATLGLAASLTANLVVAIRLSIAGAGPAIPHLLDQKLLPLFTWGFPVLAIWGFSARWLPVFLGLPEPGRSLPAAPAAAVCAVVLGAMDRWILSTAVFLGAAVVAAFALHVFERSIKPAKITGVHRTFPTFVRVAYFWLLVSAVLSLLASGWDHHGGLWGASRHALTVGFVSTMVFAIGQRVLPAFCGMRVLYSPRLMFAALGLLNLGCLMRVAAEAAAYEGYIPALWPVLPVSAFTEMAAVSIFAVNLVLTFVRKPAHLRVTPGVTGE